MSERPGLPWLQEAGYGPESRAAALAARKAKHPNWNWGGGIHPDRVKAGALMHDANDAADAEPVELLQHPKGRRDGKALVEYSGGHRAVVAPEHLTPLPGHTTDAPGMRQYAPPRGGHFADAAKRAGLPAKAHPVKPKYDVKIGNATHTVEKHGQGAIVSVGGTDRKFESHGAAIRHLQAEAKHLKRFPRNPTTGAPRKRPSVGQAQRARRLPGP